MNILIPLLSLSGPIYFAARGFSLEYVLAWAAVWTGLRFLSVLKLAHAVLDEGIEEPPSWHDRYPSVVLAISFVATLAIFEAGHLAVYWTVCRLIQISN
ncbi:hypothetical protein EOA79_20240 [Mesorhizobium sp. M1A.F.Ca.IN.020.03.2.1]|uniref:hypothetical protein n=1 Tax=Mesorhizobium sp. M1A.F.Ca.IN.020.03.2.1 TaxID=2496769 RepID=UPI000FD4AF4C|nr:hypothetical protein [Mesorhizobium sp. M1A.F.Ca.IN.020.03.2.1]RUV00535.1 hypothetical protein EOA79_20240 [Mesorhizobium sp. M1A.F.Ca.IN.020.03.2.1]